MTDRLSPDHRWQDAVLAAAVFAIDPIGLGGLIVRSQAGPARDRWLALVDRFLADQNKIRRVPLHAGPDRLLGGLDLSATLRDGKPKREPGLLASVHGGVVLLAMAERLPASSAAIIASALDRGEVHLEREGFTVREAACFGVIAFDEALEDEERASQALQDRLAFEIDLAGLGHRDLVSPTVTADQVAVARARLAAMRSNDDHVQGLTAAAMALGIGSLRAPLLALRAAVAIAALHGRTDVADEDAALAARLVLAHRATRLPMPEQQDADPADAPPEPEDQGTPESDGDGERADGPLEDRLLQAALAALPPGLLDMARGASAPRQGKTTSSGRKGMKTSGGRRGRPVGVRPGRLERGERLSVVETLRAAAPWQRLRCSTPPPAAGRRLQIRPEDIRLVRQKEPDRTTTIFVVDASGSSALQRLAEAKGAVELLLAECYTRRDQVALLAFRGQGADILLAPTRSLVRAKRALAALPGGGGTPLAAGVEAACQTADMVRRRGETPLLVFLTDGRGNLALDGTRGRQRALAEATTSAQRLAAKGHACLVIDIAARPGPEAEALATALGARYVALPRADAKSLSNLVIAARTP